MMNASLNPPPKRRLKNIKYKMISAIRTIFRIGSSTPSSYGCAVIHPLNDDDHSTCGNTLEEIVVINDWDDSDRDRMGIESKDDPREPPSIVLHHSILNRQDGPYTFNEHTRHMVRRMERIDRQRNLDNRREIVSHETHSPMTDRAQIYAAWSMTGTP
jgi:hypothetical protein